MENSNLTDEDSTEGMNNDPMGSVNDPIPIQQWEERRLPLKFDGKDFDIVVYRTSMRKRNDKKAIKTNTSLSGERYTDCSLFVLVGVVIVQEL